MSRLLVIIVFFSSFSGIGQDSLSLKKAIEIGLQKNFDIQLTQKNVAINQIMNSWGEAGSLPQINVNVGQNNSISDQRNNPISSAPNSNTIFRILLLSQTTLLRHISFVHHSSLITTASIYGCLIAS